LADQFLDDKAGPGEGEVEMTRKTFLLGLIISGFVCLSANASLVQGAQYVVNTTNDAVVGGACANGSGGCSLRGAIQQANTDPNADSINFAIPASDPGCSAGVCTITLATGLPTLSTSMGFNGPGSGKLIVRAASGTIFPVFHTSNTVTVTFSGLTISNGSNPGSGGGIWNPNGTVNVIGCTISGNHAIHGGTAAGIYSGGTLNVIDSTISGNLNSTGNGGGITNFAGTTTVVNSTISGNSGNAHGGGILNFGGGTVNVTNSTIIGNTAHGSIGEGGGIQNFAGTVTVKNSIIALNSSTVEGPDVNGTFASAGYNLIGKIDGSTGFADPTDQTGTIASPLNPMLGPLQYNGGPTRTIALLTGSPAIDKGTSNGLTGNLNTDQRGAGFRRTFDSPAIPNAAGGDGTDIGAFERGTRTPFDLDGDGKTDIGIFRPSAAEWWIDQSSTGVTFAAQFGAATDRIVPGDYTGDGRADIAVWRPATGEWFVLRSEDFSFFAFAFGLNGDVPAPADYDGDGRSDAAVFRPSSGIWFINRSTDGGSTIMQFGSNGDIPVVADYDGDNRADIAIFRPSAGQWWLNTSTAGTFVAAFGNATDKPVPGDYTGDGRSDVAVWRPSTGEWFVLRSEDSSFYGFHFGLNGDLPASGDYDGDGRFDPAVFRPSSGTWFIVRTTAGTQIVQFGANGDRPIANAFVP
jgi:CSLREA domain-containing protein